MPTRHLVPLLAVALVAPALLTASVVLPYTFTNTTVADANHVNANFTAVADGVDALDTRVTALEESPGTAVGTLASPPFACNPSNGGRLFFDTAGTTFYGCTGNNFVLLGGGDGSTQARASRKSCDAYRQAMPLAQSGLYWIDPNGGSNADAFPVYCNMSIDTNGWTMVAKYSAGVGGDASTLWTAGALNEGNQALLDTDLETAHYVNRIPTQYWNTNAFTIAEGYAAVYTGNVLKAFIRFDATSTTNTSWYAAAKVTASSWTDVTPGGSYNHFGIAGDTANTRRWFVNNLYNSCPNDVGWLLLQSSNAPACSFEGTGTTLRILYANATTKQNWTSGLRANGETFVVYVR